VESLSEVGHMADSIAPSVSMTASRENLQSLITCHATELSWLIYILYYQFLAALYTIVIVSYCFFREEKLKLKKARNPQTKQATSAVEEDLYSEDDGEKSDVDLSWLPDPDKVFPPKDEGAEDSDRSELSVAGGGSDANSSDDDSEDGADSCREEEEQRHM